jgi:hypothetical protein
MGAPSAPIDKTSGHDPSRRRAPVHARPLQRSVALPRRRPLAAVATVITLIIAFSMVTMRDQIPLRAAQLAQFRAFAQGGQAPLPTDGQGIYDSCSPAVAGCVAHLDILAHAGFQLVINYSQFAADATIADEVAYATHAQQVGMRVIWPVSAFIYGSNADTSVPAAFPTLHRSLVESKACPGYDGTNYGFVACFATTVRGMSGTWGYYIGDELPVYREPDLRHLVDTIVDVDPAHPRLFVAGSASAVVNRASLTIFGRSYCDNYACHPDATVIAQDFYPIGDEPPDAAAALTGHVAEGVAALAAQQGASYGFVLQGHSLTQYPDLYACPTVNACPYPTQGQMLAMRNAVLSHPTPRLILWYSYFDVMRSDNPALRWTNLTAAVNAGR